MKNSNIDTIMQNKINDINETRHIGCEIDYVYFNYPTVQLDGYYNIEDLKIIIGIMENSK